MSERTATLTNLDRAEYGTITVDLNLLEKQMTWLAGLSGGVMIPGEGEEEREGILGLLEGIMDMADPPNDEEVEGHE